MPIRDNVVLFDGYCNLCNRSIRLLKKTDRNKKMIFIHLQSEHAKDYLKMISPLPDSVVLYSGGRYYIKSDAVLKTAGIAGGWMHVLKLFYIIPRPIRDFIYDMIASNRYRWFGKKEVCSLPGRKLRFL